MWLISFGHDQTTRNNHDKPFLLQFFLCVISFCGAIIKSENSVGKKRVAQLFVFFLKNEIFVPQIFFLDEFTVFVKKFSQPFRQKTKRNKQDRE